MELGALKYINPNKCPEVVQSTIPLQPSFPTFSILGRSLSVPLSSVGVNTRVDKYKIAAVIYTFLSLVLQFF